MTRPEDSMRKAGGAAGHRRVAFWCAGVALLMLGAAFAAVPLYDMFCRATGFGGTTRRAERPADRVLDRTVVVRFDANVAPGLGWRFEPVERTITARYGETMLVHYRATNVSDRPLTGTASFNVAPEIAGAYFNKLACFCFQEQELAPGQSVDMPVSFFVDPAMAEDRQAGRVGQITLSYTFFPVDKPASRAAGKAGGT